MEKRKRNPVKREKNLISKRNSMEKTAEGKCTSCAGTRLQVHTRKQETKSQNPAQQKPDAENTEIAEKGADRRETGTAGKRSCSPS